MTKFLITGCVALAAAALAGFITMVVLLTKSPAAEIPIGDGGGGHLEIDCRSIVNAADAGDTRATDDKVTHVSASGERSHGGDAPQVAWCGNERTARAGLMALLAVPTTLSAAGSMLVGVAARRRPPPPRPAPPSPWGPGMPQVR